MRLGVFIGVLLKYAGDGADAVQLCQIRTPTTVRRFLSWYSVNGFDGRSCSLTERWKQRFTGAVT